MSDNFVPNPAVGGPGGSHHRIPGQDHGQAVTKLELWTGTTSEGWVVLFGIKLTWDTDASETFGTPSDSSVVLEFRRGETIKRFTVWAGYRVDKVRIITSLGRQVEAGGEGGSPCDMDVGSGVLHGVSLSSGYVIDKLQPLFFKFNSFMSSIITQNAIRGGTGGQPFWICRADVGRMRVRNIHFFYGSVLRAVQVTWEDNTLSRWHGTPYVEGDKEDYYAFDLSRSETITDMTLRTGLYADGLWFRTSSNRQLSVGGSGGSEFKPQLGTGVLVGFEGRAAYKIDALAPIFLST
ncbi:hypothetical protein HIM_02468 [Hirsutella minnesotensis 3608]|nr:hypothetical protein HIM_02468 [Hirsutella minnesotensis 3608]